MTKSKPALLAGSIAALLAVLAVPAAHAATLTWDANGATAGQTDGAGAWLTDNQWWDGAANANWTSGDDAIFGNGGVGGAVTLASPTTVNSLTFNSFITTGYTLGTAGQAITLNTGITKNAGSAAVNIISPLTLGGAQTWTNNSTANINVQAATTLSGVLTVGGSGITSFDNINAVIGGAGGIIKNGTGQLNLSGGAIPAHTFTGDITVNGGSIGFQVSAFLTGRNVKLTDGYLGGRFNSGFAWTSGLGTGANQIQITGGLSGFSGEGNSGSTFQVGTALSTLVWGALGEGSATGFFNPTVLLANGDVRMNANGKGSLNNGIDLNAATRGITSLQTTDGAANSGFSILGVISNSSGTAGIIKTGVGNLILGNANTYNGATTITQGSLTASSTGSLGNSSATNTLVFDGGALLASGAITSAATRGVTMTSTGIINTNTFAVSIAGNITGAGGLTKNGTGTLTPSGTNDYAGITTVNAGTLAITKQLALYNNTPASWTAANINVKSGATLALNVDSAGSAGFDSGNLNTLLGNISVANTAAQGLQAGATLALDTSTATGASFTPSGAITNSTGAFGGMISLTKLGAGTLVLNQANTYTGLTTTTTGTLQLDDGGSISAAPLLNNGTFAINRSATNTQGTNIPALIGGTGSLANIGAGPLVLNAPTYHTNTTSATVGDIALSNALALQNSALNTTGAGFVTLSGVTTPTCGGLSNSGATRDLATVISTGYTGVTNLTLNPQSGSTFTYGGVIADGAAGMTLTKTGAGTQVLQGVNTYTGETNLRTGTLTLSGNGTINTSTGLTLIGGSLTLNNTTAGEAALDRLSSSAGITSNGGTITSTNTSGADVYAETIGSVALASGPLNVVQSSNQTGAGSQTLTLSGLTRTGASNTSVVAFSANTTAPNATKNIIAVSGATQTPAGEIIGAWATTGTAAATQTDYAIYNSAGQIVPAALANTAETGWTTAANAYSLNTGSAVTLTGTRTITALQFFGATSTLNTATGFNLETYGLLFSGANAKTVASTGTGVLTTPTGGGNLFVTTGQTSHAISATITNNGGDVTLVKSGSNTLTLSSTTNSYSGGTVINSGIVSLTGTANTNLNSILGDAAGGITLNGGRLSVAGANISGAVRIVTVKAGGGLLFVNKNNNFTTTGKLTGAGTLTTLDGGGVGTLSTYSFNSTSNDFTGRLIGTNTIINVNSFADSANNIVLDGASFNYGTGAGSAMTLSSRAIELSGTTGGATINNANTTAANTLTLTAGLVVTGVGNKTLTLGGANTGANTFGGNITNGPGSVISLAKADAGTWLLTNNHNYTGTTGVSGGTVTFSGNNTLTGQITVSQNGTLILSGNNSGMTGNVSLSTNTSVVPKLHINSATALGTGTLTFGGGGASDTVQINNSSAGEVIVSTANAITLNRNFTFVGTQSLNLGTGTATIGGLTTGTTRGITVTANTLTFGGAIAESVANVGINKQGAGTLVLSGTGSTYTGATTVTAGTLAGIGTNAFGSTSRISIAAASSATLSLRGDSNTSFVNTSDSSLYSVTTTANGATINVDQATIAGTSARTMTIGTLLLNTAITNGTFFTGANNTSLNIGAVTTGNSASGTETLTNNIASTGSLTLASIAVNRTGTPTLAFAGSGDTTVTGNITQTAATALTKSGTGTLTLSGANTYTGATNVNGGTLNVNGTLGAGANVVNANAGATNFGVSQTLAALNIGAGAEVTLGSVAPSPTEGEEAAAFAGFGASDAEFGADGGSASVAAVPEPGAAALLLGGLATLLGLRRRKA